MSEIHVHVDINCTTGERTERILTAEEIAEKEARIAEATQLQEQMMAEIEAKSAAKVTAIQKLVETTSLTQEEAEALYS